MTDQTPEEQRIDQQRLMSGQNMDAEWDKLAGAKPAPAPEAPVKRDFMWLQGPIEVIKSLFSSLLSPADKDYRPGSDIDFRTNIGNLCYFDSNSDLLSPDTMARLQQQAEWATAYNIPGLLIEGHCASAEGTREYCLQLGEMRAQAAKDFMSTFYDPIRIETMSWGKERSVYVEPDSRNSRIETTLTWNEK